MAIPMTMLLDHSGSSLPSPSPWLPLRPPYPLPLQGFRLVFSTTGWHSCYSLSFSLVCATMSQQLRIVAVKYNGQDNDSVIYPRFGPLSVRLFPTLEENNRQRFVPSFSPPLSLPLPRPWPPLSKFSRRFTPRTTANPVFSAFKLMIINNGRLDYGCRSSGLKYADLVSRWIYWEY